MDLLMATATHPHHKLATVRAICRLNGENETGNLVADRLARELLALVQHDEQQQDPAPQQGPQPEVPQPSSSTDYLLAMEEDQQEQTLQEKVNNEIKNWSKIVPKGSLEVSTSLFPLEFRDAWVTLFVRYNTPLPSSASIERVFSYGSAILRPKRATLAAENFEALVFLKGNLPLLRKAHEVEVNE